VFLLVARCCLVSSRTVVGFSGKGHLMRNQAYFHCHQFWPRSSVLVTLAVMLSGPSWPAYAGTVLLFNDPTDTISVAGNTTLGSAATYEAQILFTSSFGSFGTVFNEWVNGQEDKHLLAGPTQLVGFNYPRPAPATPFVSPVSLSLDVWHNIAFVYSGSQERFYVDGSLLASRNVSGNIFNDDSGHPFIGAEFRDALLSASFIGYLSSLRISDVARYSGSSYSATTGDFTADANALVLFDFHEAPGTTSITDLSSAAHIGTLGVGFTGSTLPEFVENPVSAVPGPIAGGGLPGLIVAGAGLLGWLRRRHRRTWL
jgi:hypothetical protein